MKGASKRSKKAGYMPGTPLYTGDLKSGKTKISIINYGEEGYEEKNSITLDEFLTFVPSYPVRWINVEGISDVETITKICNFFNLHPLVLEDILNIEQRPKMEEYDGYIFIIANTLRWNERREIVKEQISFILGENFLLSFQEGIEGDLFDPLRNAIRSGKASLRKMKSDYLLYLLIDAIVDQYFFILENLGEEMENIEKGSLRVPSEKLMSRFHEVRKKIMYLRKSIWPMREVISKFEKSDLPFITENMRIHMRDVHDHIIYIIETVETYRETLSSLLEIFLSNISNRTNEIVKVLTIITTLFMPLTFIAGIYGMNFRYMPELEMKWGYPAVLLLMLLIALFLIFYFKRKKWI